MTMADAPRVLAGPSPQGQFSHRPTSDRACWPPEHVGPRSSSTQVDGAGAPRHSRSALKPAHRGGLRQSRQVARTIVRTFTRATRSTRPSLRSTRWNAWAATFPSASGAWWRLGPRFIGRNWSRIGASCNPASRRSRSNLSGSTMTRAIHRVVSFAIVAPVHRCACRSPTVRSSVSTSDRCSGDRCTDRSRM